MSLLIPIRLKWGTVTCDFNNSISGTCRDGTPFKIENVSAQQLHRWLMGEYIQDVMPHLSADDRKILITGTSPAAWAEAFGEEEDA